MRTPGILREHLFYLRILTITSVLSISLQIQSGKKYIGRKYFWSFRKPPGKKRKVKQESDWQKYYGSCPELKEDIKLFGKGIFSREILSLHETKGTCNYEETKQLFLNNVLSELLTTVVPRTIIATSLGAICEKTMVTLQETLHSTNEWVIDRIHTLCASKLDEDAFAIQVNSTNG